MAFDDDKSFGKEESILTSQRDVFSQFQGNGGKIKKRKEKKNTERDICFNAVQVRCLIRQVAKI